MIQSLGSIGLPWQRGAVNPRCHEAKDMVQSGD
jgi:hypothetical protein